MGALTNWNNSRISWSCEEWENAQSKWERLVKFLWKKTGKLALLGSLPNSGVSLGFHPPSHQEQTWGRSRNHLSPKLSFADCSILVVFASSPGAWGIVRQATCAARGCCWMQITPVKTSILLQTCLLSRVLSCTSNASCYLVNSDSKVPTLPHYEHQCCYHFLRDNPLLWGR